MMLELPVFPMFVLKNCVPSRRKLLAVNAVVFQEMCIECHNHATQGNSTHKEAYLYKMVSYIPE